jgi:tRNA threonylcarbamoyladenosine biosynthesis protein TsaE
VNLADAEATTALGARLAAIVEAGDVVVLSGPLGAGKTTLAQGFGRALGVTAAIRSPTYTLVDVHESGRLPLLHLDAWRLGDSTEVEGLGLDEAPVGAVLLIEWGELIAPLLSDSWLVVRLDRPVGTDVRTVELEPHGGTWADRLADL